MSDDLPDLPSLRVIEPPAHGLTKLRAAIARDDHRRSSRRRWWLITAPVAVVLALVVFSRREPAPQPTSAIVTPMPDPEISPTFYWVASTPREAKVPSKPVVLVDPAKLQPTSLELR